MRYKWTFSQKHELNEKQFLLILLLDVHNVGNCWKSTKLTENFTQLVSDISHGESQSQKIVGVFLETLGKTLKLTKVLRRLIFEQTNYILLGTFF